MEQRHASRRTALAGYVDSLRHYDIDGFPAGEHIGLPSTGVTLVIPLEAPLELSMPQTTRRSLSVCLAGLHDGPATIHHNGTQRGIQLALNPLRLTELLGVSGSELAGQTVELGDVIGDRTAATLLDRINSTATWAQRRMLAEQALLHQLDPHHRSGALRPEVQRAWERLAVSGGRAKVHDLAIEVGWSARHLTERFSAVIGLTPKRVARIMRFERSAALIGRGHGSALVAAQCGYSDQAHMTREWQRLAGTTPGRWMRDDVLANVQDNSATRDQDRRHANTN